MKTKKISPYWFIAVALFLLFAGLMFAVKFIGVDAIGPEGSEIGLSSVNAAVRDAVGVNDIWYNITEIIGYLAIAVAAGFAVLGLCQLVKRRSIKKIDKDILLLAVFYVLVVAAYVGFEIVVINYRPVLVDGVLEASFPSSHTMLAVSIFGSAIYQFVIRFKNKFLRIGSVAFASLLMAVMAVGRLLSGVHWFTDIIGALILSATLITLYVAANSEIKTAE